MVKPLHFKGDKKVKKRKRVADPSDDADTPASKALTTTNAAENDAAAAEEDDSWVNADAPSDISGPIVVVLPTKPITFLACDAIGKVFCSEVENCVDGKAETAEPHDVRQVWVASRVAGTENLSLKGHHGRYLSVSKQGILSATATAISPSESLLALPAPSPTDTSSSAPSTFALQTTNSTYLGTTSTSSTPEIRGDATELSADGTTTFHIRMQARFKPRNKVAKAEKAAEKITRKELEAMVGRKLEDSEVRILKRAKKEGDFYERLLDFKVKGSHDKYA
ncbi:hypothetical protein DM02DRAFT_618399 [Periconia macrospinosa]|uniref:Actin-crosslinking protein n=1 Tax=Periconia macrospinosa TaxID=97972 RepID=A0A2V1DC03_9PLEO|nr:hypothetical protein DM02DRAFT_618399 [Periconia macrospinosa]